MVFNPAAVRMGEAASTGAPAPSMNTAQATIDRLQQIVNSIVDPNVKSQMQSYLDNLKLSGETSPVWWSNAEVSFASTMQAAQASPTPSNPYGTWNPAAVNIADQISQGNPPPSSVLPQYPFGPTPAFTPTPTGQVPGVTPGAPQGQTGIAPTVVSTYTDPTTGDVIAIYSDGSTKTLSTGTKIADAAKAAADKAAADAAAAAAKALADKQAADAAAAAKKATGQSAWDALNAFFGQYGLGSLTNDVQKYIQDGLSYSELLLRLRTESPAYKKRFAANETRIANGLAAIDEASYIKLEDAYQDIMRRYGLPESYYSRGDLGVQSGFEKFIGLDVSPPELEDRIQTAQNRVINANPEVSRALKEFYPDITNGDMLAYVLDPKNAIQNIKRKVTAAEIGGAAMQFGLGTGLSRAEELAKYGVTKQQAEQGYQTVAEVLPRGSQLSEFYKQGPYNQATAEAEVFGTPGAVEAAKQRKKITQLEQASFAGSSGAAQSALARERAGQF